MEQRPAGIWSEAEIEVQGTQNLPLLRPGKFRRQPCQPIEHRCMGSGLPMDTNPRTGLLAPDVKSRCGGQIGAGPDLCHICTNHHGQPGHRPAHPPVKLPGGDIAQPQVALTAGPLMTSAPARNRSSALACASAKRRRDTPPPPLRYPPGPAQGQTCAKRRSAGSGRKGKVRGAGSGAKFRGCRDPGLRTICPCAPFPAHFPRTAHAPPIAPD